MSKAVRYFSILENLVALKRAVWFVERTR